MLRVYILIDIEHIEYPTGYLSILDLLCDDIICGPMLFLMADFQRQNSCLTAFCIRTLCNFMSLNLLKWVLCCKDTRVVVAIPRPSIFYNVVERRSSLSSRLYGGTPKFSVFTNLTHHTKIPLIWDFVMHAMAISAYLHSVSFRLSTICIYLD